MPPRARGQLTWTEPASGTLLMGAPCLASYPDFTLLFELSSLISARRSSMLHQFRLPKMTFRR